MKPTLRILDLPADRMEGEVVATLIFEDERPLRGPAALLDWRLNGRLTKLLLERQVRGRRAERVMVGAGKKILAPWVLFHGGGRLAHLDAGVWRSLVAEMLDTACQAGFSRVALCLAPLAGQQPEEIVRALESELGRFAERGMECLLSIDDSSRRVSDKEQGVAQRASHD